MSEEQKMMANIKYMTGKFNQKIPLEIILKYPDYLQEAVIGIISENLFSKGEFKICAL